ncbi:hypothetical protein [Ruixingdingia sedimenti]|uniref:Uncharacterized protein n=1 Tax=Ruixingdingia sedimenti TaxID=3073604 RepID=A0ABU1F701_9RHOB|nr:hypothetical protein [Xinfangfangia sp. LG-4]MDR5652378.1 hypothetical protein [Xinfangfangia sp. LG-4]
MRLRLALATLCALLPGAAAAQTDAVALACGGAGGGHVGVGPVCAALERQLAARYGAVRQGAALTIRFEMLRDDAQMLSGRLHWQGRTGPVVEVTANDRPLDARAAGRLAEGLMRMSSLPD